MLQKILEGSPSAPSETRDRDPTAQFNRVRKQGVRAHYRRARLRGFSVRDSIQLVALSVSVRILQRRAS